MIEEFMKYTSDYNSNKEEVKNKIEHSLRVCEMMQDFAEELGFSEDEIKMASEIGLLHDIGRFEQIKMIDGMCDLSGFDHADYGVKILFEDGLIKNFVSDESHYDAIKFAIAHHNKYDLEETGKEPAIKLAKLIRDVDKIDILYLTGELGLYDMKGDDSEISASIIESFMNNQCVLKGNVKTHNDAIACSFALAFDINYSISLKAMRKNLVAFYNRVECDGRFKEIYEKAIHYLDERIDA